MGQQRERVRRKDLRGEEDRSMLHIYILRQYNETYQTLFEKGGKREGRKKIQ
jgi:hypothetical protein